MSSERCHGTLNILQKKCQCYFGFKSETFHGVGPELEMMSYPLPMSCSSYCTVEITMFAHKFGYIVRGCK